MNYPNWIIIHGTDVSYTKLKNQLISVNGYHKSLGNVLSREGYYVGYHTLITDGVLYRTRLESEEGAHTNQQFKGQSMNKQSLGVCVGFDGDVEYPTQADYSLLKRQVKSWQGMYNIPNDRVVFHRYFNTAKTCPGSLLGKEWLEILLADPVVKPDDQEEKQKEILMQKISILQKLINLYLKLKHESS